MRACLCIPTTVALMVSIALQLAACSDSAAPSQDGAPRRADGGPITTPAIDLGSAPDAAPDAPRPADYCEAIVEMYCAFFLRCGRMAAPDEQTCRAAFLETCNARYEPRYAALAQAGLLELSAAGLARCAAHLTTVPCEQQFRDLEGGCDAIWIGQQPAAQPCGFDVESFVCRPGAACVLSLDLCGICKAQAALGDGCGGEITCGDGARCSGGKCVARARLTEACDAEHPCVIGARCEGGKCVLPAFVGPDAACDSTHRCQYLSSCVGGTCKLNARLGEACDASTVCDSGRCDLPAAVCVAPLPADADCNTGGECLSGRCGGGKCDGIPSHCFTP